MENKDVIIGFILLVAVSLTIPLNNWYSIVIDLLLLSSYYFIKHMYIVYKTETYISRVNMKPAYGFLALSVLFFGILRILYIYSNVFSSSALYGSMPSILKAVFYVDILFMLVFIYLIIKFTFSDLLDFNLSSPHSTITEMKEEEKEIKIEEEKKEEDTGKEEEKKEERGIKKLPVIIVSRK